MDDRKCPRCRLPLGDKETPQCEVCKWIELRRAELPVVRKAKKKTK